MIPPISGRDPSQLTTPAVTLASLESQRPDSEFDIEFETLFYKQVKLSQENRLKKVASLSEKQQAELSILQEKLTLMHQNIQKFEASESEEEIDFARRQIIELQNDIYNKHTNFLLQPKRVLEIPYKISLLHYKESTLNAFANRAAYKNEITANIKMEISNIISCFDLLPSELADIEFLESETHNEGRSTCCFYLQNQVGRTKFVYKPRSARVDDIVISTFSKINALEEITDKSAIFDLPKCKIYHCKNESSSIWEYISDQSLRENNVKAPPTLGSYVADMSDDLLIKAVRMDDVLSLLHIGDLHGENILIRKYPDRPIDFVPIDLEVVYFPKDPEQPTKTGLATLRIKEKLVKTCKYTGLTEAEKTVIREMRKEFRAHTARFVPLGTYNLVQKLLSLSNYKYISQVCKSTIISDGFKPVNDINALLEENILLDYLNNDVPYFSLKEGLLYYGSPSKKIVLASMEDLL